MAIRLNLLVIRSSDIDAAARFYEELGLRFCRHSHGSGPAHYALDDPGCVFEIYPLREGEPSTASTRIGFEVDSVDERLNRLVRAGGSLVSPPKLCPWGYRAVVEDRDGHRIELSSTGRE